MRPFIAAFALLVLAAATAGADKEKGSGQDTETMVDRIFLRLDTDKDGRISRDERGKAPRFKKAIQDADADKDGFVTRKELKHALDRKRP